MSHPDPAHVPPHLPISLTLPRDHSSWARSVRWSCGRPALAPFDLLGSYLEASSRLLGLELEPWQVAYLEAGIRRPEDWARVTGIHPA